MSSSFSNRTMYWRIVRRMLFGNRVRLLVILLALGSGATVTAALLNLQVDAKRRLTTEFTVFGPNVVITPSDSLQSSTNASTLDARLVRSIPVAGAPNVSVSSVLYAVTTVTSSGSGAKVTAVAAGQMPFGFLRVGTPSKVPPIPNNPCVLGSELAEKLSAAQDSELTYAIGSAQGKCILVSQVRRGGPEDNQLLLPLPAVQKLTNLPERLSAIELTVSGKPGEIQSYISDLQHRLPGVEVRPVRQFTEAQAKIYGRISGVLNLTVVMVLVLTALCVMAAMANVAIERRNDVGLMKAIGGTTRRVLRLFLVEAALLGLAGGMIGGALGILVSVYLGKAVFGLAAQPRWVVYPVSMSLTLFVAIVAAFPLRRLAGVRPASVFRGEA